MDVVTLLKTLEEMRLIRTHRIIGNYYQIYCPIHNDGQERKPSCGVLLHEEVRNGQKYPEGFSHCFACGLAKTLPDLITEILETKNITNRSGLDWLKENIPGFEEPEFDYLLPRDLVQTLNNKYAVSYIAAKTQTSTEYVSEEELSSYRYTVPYMYERKLTDEVILKFDVGVDLHYNPGGRVKEVPCITFPVRNQTGDTLFVYRRAISSKNFFMPAGLEKPLYGIYELPKDTTSVILCESIINALTCYVYGYPAIALFGTGTRSQIENLKRLGMKEFILGLDGDDAGIRGSSKLKSALKSVAIVRNLNIPQGKDINDLDCEEFKILMRNRL